jgi:hypothetical protein
MLDMITLQFEFEDYIKWARLTAYEDRLELVYLDRNTGIILLEDLPYTDNPELQDIHDGTGWNVEDVYHLIAHQCPTDDELTAYAECARREYYAELVEVQQ